MFFIYIIILEIQGASCLARSLKVVNEALTSLDLGFNEIRVRVDLSFLISFSHVSHVLHLLITVL